MTTLTSPLTLYTKALEARLVDNKMELLAKQNKGGAFHLFALGHELVGTAFGLALRSGHDWALPYYRDRAVVLALGVDPKELFGAFMARETPHHSRGRMMPEHFSHKELHIPCQSSVVGSQFLHAVGVAMGAKRSNTDEVVYVSGGDGSTSQGDYHEALNFSCLHNLPIVFCIQDNGWAISVPRSDQTAPGCASKFGAGYKNLHTIVVDGTDLLAIDAAAQEAVSHARTEGPVVVVTKIPRIGPHSSSDDPKKYKTANDFALDKTYDPITKAETYLLDEGLITPEKLTALREETKARLDTLALEAENYPHPENPLANLYDDTVPEQEEGPTGEPVVMMDALNHALAEEMERDKTVLVFGQDVARGKGGVFGITRGLTDQFGEDRIFNTPLAESTIIGVAIGLSHYGYKPVVEIQFCDYMWTAMNQIVNELSSMHYRSGGEWSCNVTIRMPYGGYIQGGPYHSQTVETYLCHTPGLKVCIPSNASDAKRALKTAIRDPNPVILLEHKALYRQRAFAALPEPTSTLTFPHATTLKEGSDLTIITWGLMTSMAADIIREHTNVEHIDLLTLAPLDLNRITTSLKKTGKLLIIHEANKTCGFGAELSALISETCFPYLDAPIHRICGKDRPIPYAKSLELAILPSKEEIQKAIATLITF